MFSVITPYILLLSLTGIACLGVTVVSWQNRQGNPNVIALTVSWATATVWTAAYAFQLSSQTLNSKLFWFNVSHIGVVLFPVCAFLVVLNFTGRVRWYEWRRIAVPLVGHLPILLFIWTNPWHQLFMRDLELDSVTAGAPLLVGERASGFWLVYSFGYLVILVTLVLGAQAMMNATVLFRRQIGLLLVSGAPLLVANVLFVADVTPLPDLNVSPVMFLPMVIGFVLGFYRFQLLAIARISSETIIQSVPNGLIVLDAHNQVVSFNSAAQRIVAAFSLEEGGAIETYIDNWEAVLNRSITSLNAPSEILFEGDEGERYYEVRISPLYADGGQLYGRLITLNDVTERRAAEELQMQQNQYMDALHETSLGVIQRFETGELLSDLIDRACQLLQTPHGYIYLENEDSQGLHLEVGIGYFKQFEGEQINGNEGVVRQVWQSGHPMMIADYGQWPGRVIDNQQALGAVMALPLSREQQTVGVIGVATAHGATEGFTNSELDLLDRFARLASITLSNAQLYAEVAAARAEAEEANETKSNFLANVSHELRTPLTSILGFTKIIQKRFEERILPEVQSSDKKVLRAVKQVRQNFDIIIKEGDRLSALINDVLDLEKIEAGQMEWHLEPLQVADVIERVLSTTAPLFAQKGLRPVRHVADGLPLVNGDADQLHQVMTNLVSNAVKFTDEGSVTCAARLEGETIIVSVADTGVGIAAEDLPRVFNKFTQLGNTLTDKPKGTGLGLPICQYIVDQHGGRIWLESVEGEGTTFLFTLPVLESLR